MTKIEKNFLFPIFTIILLFPQLSYSQKDAPQWTDEARRSANYPSNKYYVGFSQDIIKSKSNDVSLALKSLERDAQSKMAENIIANVKSKSVMTTNADSQRQGKNINYSVSDIYRQTVEVSSDASLVKTEIFSYHDQKTNKIYAMAAVKKSDLADYYATKISFFLDETRRGIDLSKQLFELDKKIEARGKLNESENYTDSAASFRTLLITVDTENGLKRSQGERAGVLLKEIAVVRTEIQAKNEFSVFVGGTEKIENKICDIIVSGLQTILSDNNIAITENEKESDFILKIDAKICSRKEDGHFYYANACVKVALSNVETGKNEVLITVKGEKKGGLNTQSAGEEAFRSVVLDVWAKIKDRIMEN